MCWHPHGAKPASLTFLLLHRAEGTSFASAAKAIVDSALLTRYVTVVNASLRTLGELASVESSDDNDAALRIIAAQMFNSSAAALSLAMSAYYQQSALLQRHLLETGFLLDVLRTDDRMRETWRRHTKPFRPSGLKNSQVTAALDTRDGIKRGCREQTYVLLSNLAAHMVPVSARRMVAAGDWRMVGPFHDAKRLEFAVGEVARNLPYFTEVAAHALPNGTPATEASVAAFRQALRGWLRRLGHDIDTRTDVGLTEYARVLWGAPRREPDADSSPPDAHG